MRTTALLVGIVGLLLVMACTPQLVPQEPPVLPVTPPGEGGVRPDIPRVLLPPEPTVVNDTLPEVPELSPIRNSTRDGRSPIGIELDLLIGEVIADRYPYLTGAEFPLLRHPRARPQAGLGVEYTEELWFDLPNATGRVIVGKDDDDNVGSFLFFAQDAPIFEYRLRLEEGTFHDLEGWEIQVLGRTYVIAEADDTYLTLYGRTVASNLGFSNGSRMHWNGSTQTNTEVRMWPDEVRVRVLAPDVDDEGVLLAPDGRLSAKIGQGPFASDLFDLQYLGIRQDDSATLTLDRTGSGYRLLAQMVNGDLNIPIASVGSDGALVLGRPDERLHVSPCPSGLPYCVAPGDRAILTSPTGESWVLEYVTARNDTDRVTMRWGDEKESFDIDWARGTDEGTAWIELGPWEFRAEIGPGDAAGKRNISIDQGFVEDQAEIVLRTGARVRIGDANATAIPFELVIPRTREWGEERTAFEIRREGSELVVWIGGNVTLVEDEEENLAGSTPYGVGVLLSRDERAYAERTGRELGLVVPATDAVGTVVLLGTVPPRTLK